MVAPVCPELPELIMLYTHSNPPQGDKAMCSTTIDHTGHIAAVSGDYPEQAVTLTFTSEEVVLTCDGTVVRGRLSRGHPASHAHFSPELYEALFGETSPLSPVSRGHVLDEIAARLTASA